MSNGIRSGVSLRKAAVAIAVAAIGFAVLMAFYLAALSSGQEDGAVAAETLRSGRAIYAEHCASCHGLELESQPDWTRPLPSGRLPAPPHDETGHTWHHPDRVLFEITKRGPRRSCREGGGNSSAA